MSTVVTQQSSHYRHSHWVEKLVLSKLFWVCSVAFFFGYPLLKSVGRQLPGELPKFVTLERYSLFDEAGRSFGSSELKGKVYLLHFMTSDCSGQCDLSFKEMQKVQHRLRGVVDRAAIVSVSTRSEMDSTGVLYAKARELKANANVWRFVTGAQADVAHIISQLRIPMMNGKTADDGISAVEANQLVLVDQNGVVRGYYPIIKDGINRLMIDVGLLINRQQQS